MNTALFAAIGIGSLLTLGVPARTPANAATLAADTTLASKIMGKWSVTRYDSSSTAGHKLTMSWKKGADGSLDGTVTMPNGPSYATKVVWSSDTAFISESAPHQSPELREKVVTRMVSHFKGDSLSGTFELRPMTYRGRSETGRFVATRES